MMCIVAVCLPWLAATTSRTIFEKNSSFTLGPGVAMGVAMFLSSAAMNGLLPSAAQPAAVDGTASRADDQPATGGSLMFALGRRGVCGTATT
jgi:hypothetical protein